MADEGDYVSGIGKAASYELRAMIIVLTADKLLTTYYRLLISDYLLPLAANNQYETLSPVGNTHRIRNR